MLEQEIADFKRSKAIEYRANRLLIAKGFEKLVHHKPGEIQHGNWEKAPRTDLKRAFFCARRTNETKADRLGREADLMASSGFLAPKRIVKE